MFHITCGKGFQMTFPNGWTVSVQFGTGNYCAVRNEGGSYYYEVDSLRKTGRWSSPTAEIAAWDKNDNWLLFGQDKVKGYATPAEVAQFIAEVAAKP